MSRVANESEATKIKLLLDIVEKDRRHVMIYVSICFAIPAFTIANIKDLPRSYIIRGLLILALGSFIGAGVSYFTYAQRIHWKRLAAIQHVVALNAPAVRTELFDPASGIWATAGCWYRCGNWLIFIAAFLYVAFFLTYVLLGVRPGLDVQIHGFA